MNALKLIQPIKVWVKWKTNNSVRQEQGKVHDFIPRMPVVNMEKMVIESRMTT